MYAAPLVPDVKRTNIAGQPIDAIEASALLHDIRRVILSNRSIIDIAPLQVYVSALVFSPARSMTREVYRQEEPKWITTRPAVEEDWSSCRQTLEGHSDWVNSVAFSRDSTLIASASGDKTVKIWDTATGTCRQTLEGRSHWVRSIAFSRDLVVVWSELMLAGAFRCGQHKASATSSKKSFGMRWTRQANSRFRDFHGSVAGEDDGVSLPLAHAHFRCCLLRAGAAPARWAYVQ
jgi:hypothetical protein